MILISVFSTEDYSLLLSLYCTERPNPEKISLIYLYECWGLLYLVDGAGNSRIKLQQAWHVLGIGRSVARGWITWRIWMGQSPSRESLKNSLDKVCQKCFPWLTAQGKGWVTSGPSQGYLPSMLKVLCYARVLCTKLLVSWRFLELKPSLEFLEKMAFGEHILLWGSEINTLPSIHSNLP